MNSMNISYSFGMVDLMHYGHINAMKKAFEGADLSIFGLLSDEASDTWFGVHVSSEAERHFVLEGIKYIDEIWEQKTFDPIDNLRILHAKYPDAVVTLFTSNEWAIISAKKYVESIGGKVVKLNYYDKLSSQSILDKLNTSETKDYSGSSNLISTKANTLQALRPILSKSRIEDIYIVSVAEFKNDPDKCVSEICQQFGENKIVVRSSSKREDAFEESNAGHFTSILNINPMDAESVKNALATVMDSYGEDTEDDEQILVQKQTENVIASGVVFTRDIQRNRPYYVINYDSTGSTDSVTSGSGGLSVWISRSVAQNQVPKKWKNLMEAIWELEDVLSNVILDIEFAITPDSVVIFQVRPLAAAYKFGRKNNDRRVEEIRKEIIRKYRKRVDTGLTCFSDMAFWNPAEIIGDNPKNLDFSLYREIITQSSWDAGLVPMGYRPVPKELMYRFGNKPYISVERSFEALIPDSISEKLSLKLKDYYIDKFKKDLSAHDKIEFEISYNCFDFSLHGRLAKMMMDGFDTEEILELENALKTLTEKVLSTYDDVLKADMADLRQLECVRLDIQNITKNSLDYQLIAKSIRTLLEAIKRFGTPQFSRQARCAFIAKSLCRSLVTEGYISAEDYNGFMSGITTVASDYDKDFRAVLDGRMDKEDFILTYGHLRAGTYNIRSPRYDQMEKLFYDGNTRPDIDERTNPIYNQTIISATDNALSDHGVVGLSGDGVVHFIQKAIEQREYFKFIFTKSLSYVIELIKQMGSIVGVELHDLSYIELPEVYAAEYYSDIDRLHEFWELIIDKRKDLYKANSEIILPAVICTEQDLSYIENINSRPNYITENIISGDVVVLNDDSDIDIDGKIVVVEKADPGYDWIFSKGIVGLVTKYGGAASHMAIRCAEFRIPAAIGCGGILFDYVSKSNKLTIDCKHEKMIRTE